MITHDTLHNNFENSIPLISVLIPCFNEAGVIGRLLNDLQSNTMRDFEVIVCDNGSVDNTVNEIRRFADHDSRIHLVQLDKPNVSKARNTAAQHAKGNFLLFLDADSKLRPDFLQKSLDQMQLRNLCVATFLLSIESNHCLDQLLCRIANFFITVLSIFHPNAPGSAGYMVWKGAHKYSGGYDEHMSFGEDVDYLRRAATFGHFGIIKNARCIIDTRRLELEGRWSVTKRLLLGTWYQRGGRKIDRLPFDYHFGHYKNKKSELNKRETKENNND